jgi:HlyD family secretion protein
MSGDVVKKGSGKGRRASVWVLSGDSLVQKVIRTGLNDDTNVEVISGLSGDEAVVTGAQAAPAAKGSAAAPTSPFMPRRATTPPKKPAAK